MIFTVVSLQRSHNFDRRPSAYVIPSKSKNHLLDTLDCFPALLAFQSNRGFQRWFNK
jgi:hypothetical protein